MKTWLIAILLTSSVAAAVFASVAILPARATSISNCQVLTSTGSYALANDLPGSGGILTSTNTALLPLNLLFTACIIVSASAMGSTIDLAGHTIAGSVDVGIAVLGTNVLVESTVAGATVSGECTGVVVLGNGNTVRDLTITGGTCGPPFGFRGAAILLTGAISNTITHNTLVSNGPGYGIFLDGSPGNTITHNAISGNALGIVLDVSGATDIEHNTVTGNTGDGLKFEGFSPSNTIMRNTFSMNGNDGLETNANGNTIMNNIVDSNGNDGIAVSSSSNLIDSNNVHNNARYGIALGTAFGVPSGSNNCIKENHVAGNLLDYFWDGIGSNNRWWMNAPGIPPATATASIIPNILPC